VEQFIEKLLPPLRKFLDLPFIFFGHSLGGLIAFELARTLRRENLPQPVALFLSACGAPHLVNSNLPIHHLPDSGFIAELTRLNGIPQEIFRNPEAMQLILPVLRGDFEAAESYKLNPNAPPLACPIHAFGALDDPRVSHDQIEGWAAHTTSAFKPHYFSGGHFFLDPNKDAIIETIVKELA